MSEQKSDAPESGDDRESDDKSKSMDVKSEPESKDASASKDVDDKDDKDDKQSASKDKDDKQSASKDKDDKQSASKDKDDKQSASKDKDGEKSSSKDKDASAKKVEAVAATAKAKVDADEDEDDDQDDDDQDDEDEDEDDDDEDDPDLWDRISALGATHGALPALLLLTVCCMIVYHGLFDGELSGDDLSFHLAESARISDCLRVHDFDCWNPSGNAGYASAYYYQVIPQLASAIPAAIFGHLLFWFQLSNFLPLVLAPAAAYRGMRLLGATPWQAFAGAFVVATINGESRWGSGAAGSFQVGLYTQTWALSAFPLALGYCARWMKHGDKLAPAVAWGTFVCLCHPFAVIGLVISLICGFFAHWLPSRENQSWSLRAAIMFVLGGLCVLILSRDIPQRENLQAPQIGMSEGFHMWWAGIPTWGIAVCVLSILAGIAIGVVFYRSGGRWVFRSSREVLVELMRLSVLGGLMVVAWMPLWAPLLIDYAGFGGFPHRVGDEIGPGFATLAQWFLAKNGDPGYGDALHGRLLEFSFRLPPAAHQEQVFANRLPLVTLMFPAVVAWARGSWLRWLWPPALVFALFLGFGPHMSTTQDDLLPMVRFLGAMQTLLALGIGAGAVAAGHYLWKLGAKTSERYVYHTLLSMAAAALLVLVAWPGAKALKSRVHNMQELTNQHHDELLQVGEKLSQLPQGKKQVSAGAENHWWNLLTYVYGRTPSLLQMGGGGLQASPNYDYLWTEHDFAKRAWVYDAPYVVFNRAQADKAPFGETVFDTSSYRVRIEAFNWLAVKFVFAPASDYEIRRLKSPGLVSPVQITGVLPPGTRKGDPGHDAALEWLKSDLPMADHLLAYDGYGGVGDPPDATTISSKWQDSPGDEPDIVADVQVNKPSTFVFRESWHPRWHGYVDGNEVPVRRVTPDFPAIDVPVGHHEISLRFERPWWALAAWFAWPGVSIAAWLLLRRWRRTHPANPPANADAERLAGVILDVLLGLFIIGVFGVFVHSQLFDSVFTRVVLASPFFAIAVYCIYRGATKWRPVGGKRVAKAPSKAGAKPRGPRV